MTFRRAAEQTPHLRGKWRDGLGALRREDRPHIRAEDTRRLRGSVDIDTALQPAEPQAHRWDFAIGYQHENTRDEFIYFVETHTASDHEVNRVILKARWLHEWLGRAGNRLNAFDREVVWVSSGETRFTLTSTQGKQMALLELKQVGRVLKIRNRRPS